MKEMGLLVEGGASSLRATQGRKRDCRGVASHLGVGR